MVGAVVVREGRRVGTGYHARFGGPHAEVVALAEAGPAARGATLYVTLEPCCHTGKTPPCTDAIVAAGVARVVAAMRDPFPRVAGGGLLRLREAGLRVDVGLLGEAAARLNAPYLKRLATGLPYVTAKWAMTLDGKTATASGDSRWISNPRSRACVHELRGRMDAILVGIGTALADDPQLTARPPGPRQPARVVLDGAARLPVRSRLAQDRARRSRLGRGDRPGPRRPPRVAGRARLRDPDVSRGRTGPDPAPARRALPQGGDEPPRRRGGPGPRRLPRRGSGRCGRRLHRARPGRGRRTRSAPPAVSVARPWTPWLAWIGTRSRRSTATSGCRGRCPHHGASSPLDPGEDGAVHSVEWAWHGFRPNAFPGVFEPVGDPRRDAQGEKLAPKAVVGRVSLYLRQLETFQRQGHETISSSLLGAALTHQRCPGPQGPGLLRPVRLSRDRLSDRRAQGRTPASPRDRPRLAARPGRPGQPRAGLAEIPGVPQPGLPHRRPLRQRPAEGRPDARRPDRRADRVPAPTSSPPATSAWRS